MQSYANFECDHKNFSYFSKNINKIAYPVDFGYRS